ncbi:MAG: ABC transporter substrate-binding protein [Candidatus Berkelbacteria bacterium]|nr:ABC transporter substrate-binding protein [Candidatus Berkelbacteria bacterium]
MQSDGYNGPFRQSFDGIKLEKKNDSEFSLILPETNSSFASILSEIGILPQHKLKDVKPELFDKNDFNLNPIGSGRFGFDPKGSKKNGNNEVILKRALTYQKDNQGYFDQVTFRSYSSSVDLIEAYRKGEINGFGGFTPSDIASIDRKTFRYYRLLIPRFTAVFLNLDKENLKELKFRQALASAVDKEQIVKEVYGGDAEILKSPIPSFALGYNADVLDYPFNLSTSEAILAGLKYVDDDKDGVLEKNGKKLELTLYTTDDPCLQKISDLVSANWNKIGIKTNVIVIDLLTLQKTIIPSRQYDAVILGENLDYPPDPYPYFHSSQINGGFNISVYKNLAVDSLLEDARLSIDPAFRTDKIKNFSKIVSGDLPAVFICSAPYLYGTNISVKGVPKIRIAENSSDRFLEIGSWYIKSERKSK